MYFSGTVPNRIRIGFLYLGLAIFSLNGCTVADDEPVVPDLQKSECQLGGAAVKGVIDAANVTVYTVDANGANGEAVGTATTDKGSWSSAPSTCSADGFYRVEVDSGTYTSEATQATKENTVTYTAIVDLNSVDITGSAESLTITPISTFIDERATNIIASKSFIEKLLFGPTSLSDAIASATEEIKTHFGLEGNPLVLQVNFDDSTAMATNPDGTKLGLILGAFTQAAENLGLDDTGVLMEAMAADFGDGEFDGRDNGEAIVITEADVTIDMPEDAGTALFIDALNDYMNNSAGTFAQSGIVIDDVADIIADITSGISSGDTTAPSTTATPAGGSFTTEQSVTLACSDGAGSGCAATYYTTDGTTPTDASTAYSSAIAIEEGTSEIMFYSVDNAGNAESIKTETYTLDTIAPTTTASPTGGLFATSQSVTLVCSDGAGSGCAATYYTTDGSTPTSASTAYSSAIAIGEGTSEIMFYSVDSAGNEESVNTEAYTLDTTAPTVSSMSIIGDIGVDASPSFTVTFDEEMDSATITDSFTVTDPLGTTVAGSVSYDSNTKTATFTPTGSLFYGATYTATVTTGATDILGNPFASASLSSLTVSPSPVSAGNDHSLALLSDGLVWAWGINMEGELGIGNTTYAGQYVSAQTVDSEGSVPLSNIKSVTADGKHSLALDSDGTVWAWGFNSNGQLGGGTSGTDSSVPVHVPDASSGLLSGIVAVAGGYIHSLAVDDTGAVWSWGTNNTGELGDGTNTLRNTPVQVCKEYSGSCTTTLSGITAVDAGVGHSLALDNTGGVWGWGAYNSNGELGNDLGFRCATWNFATPVADSTGLPALLSRIVGIAVGWYHSLALKDDGTVWAWGSNGSGQLGDGTSVGTSNIPKQVCEAFTEVCDTYLADVVSISAGNNHSLALKKDGSVWAWGVNSSGQLGDGTTVMKTVATQVVDSTGNGKLSKIIAIDGGGSHSIAFSSDGTIWTMGDNWYGQLGNDCWAVYDSNKPIAVIEFGTGTLHNCDGM